MVVLITGGLGQIGSHLAEALLEKGARVIVVDDLSVGRREHLISHSKLSVFIGSVSNKTFIFKIFKKYLPDIVVHAAASHKNTNSWRSDVLTNCLGGLNTLEASRNFGASRFIYFQTGLVYGSNSVLPVSTLAVRKPTNSSYAITKYTFERLLELSDMSYVSFRLANIIGPRNLIGPLPIFYHRIKANKTCYVADTKRDFVDVRDLIKIVMMACDGVGRGAFNFSTGVERSIKDFYEIIAQAMGASGLINPIMVPISQNDVPSILLDSSDTFREFGKIDFIPLTKTVDDAIKYFDSAGFVMQNSRHLFKKK